MEAIGAAQMTSAAARSMANPAIAARLQPSGGAVAPTVEPIVTTTKVRPMSIELTSVQGDELVAVQSLVAGAGLPFKVTAVNPSADVLKAEARTEQASGRPARRQSVELSEQVDSLMTDLIAGRGDQDEIIRLLDALRKVIKVVQRSEERRDLLTELLVKAMIGAVTPELLKRAKGLGLEEVVKAVIVDAIKRGYITKAVAQPLADALRSAGIHVPELEVLVKDLRSVDLKQDAALVDARRAEEQLIKDPLATGTADGGVRTMRGPLAGDAGSAPIASAHAGVRAFQ